MNNTACQKNIIRPWVYICHSKIDFYDLWLSILFLILGIHTMFIDPISKVWYYEPAAELGLSSYHTALIFIFIGFRKYYKNFYAHKT